MWHLIIVQLFIIYIVGLQFLFHNTILYIYLSLLSYIIYSIIIYNNLWIYTYSYSSNKTFKHVIYTIKWIYKIMYIMLMVIFFNNILHTMKYII